MPALFEQSIEHMCRSFQASQLVYHFYWRCFNRFRGLFKAVTTGNHIRRSSRRRVDHSSPRLSKVTETI